MKIEKTSGVLRESSERLFNLIQELTGKRPFLRESAWYRAENAKGRAFLFMRLVGTRAKRNPPNSLHLAARYDPRLVGERLVEGMNWFESQRSIDFVARADSPEDMILAEEFLLNAYRLRNQHLPSMAKEESILTHQTMNRDTTVVS